MPGQDWPGVSYRTGLISDGFRELVNTTHVDTFVLRRRPGFTRSSHVAGTSMTPFNGRIMVQATDNTIRSTDPTTLAVSASLATATAVPGTWARVSGRTYWSNGAIGPYVFDTETSAARTPGIAAPSTAAIGPGTVTASAGLITAGSHLFRYRYKNSTTGFVSDPSGSLAKTMADLDSISFSIGTSGTDIIRSVTAGVDQIILEVTVANGAEFYQATTVANAATAVVFAAKDQILTAQLPSALFGDDGNLPMPAFDLIAEHRGRVLGFQASTNLLGWSRAALPESWDLTRYARKLSNVETSDTVTGMQSFLGDLYLFNKYGMARFVYVDDPSSGSVLSIPTDEGLWNQRCVVSVAGTLYGMGPSGVWRIRAIAPEHISTDVDPYIEANIDISKVSQAFGWYNQKDRSITWVFVKTGDSYPKIGVTYSIRTNTWSTREYNHDLLGAVYAYYKNYLATTTGYLSLETENAFDGVATVISATVNTGSTDTVIQTVESMGDYIGATLTIDNEVRLITAYTANSLTVSPAFTGTPATGTAAYVGAFEVRVKTSWWTQTLSLLQNPCYIALEFEPGQSTRSYTFEVLLNFNESPIVWSRSEADTPPAGVTYDDGDTQLTLAADGGAGQGFIPIPMPSDFSRCISMTFRCNQPTDPFGLISMKLVSRDAAKTIPGITE